MTPAEQLARGVAALGTALPAGAEQRMLAYLDLLARWNKVYNLTAIRDPGRMVTHHLLDSLAVIPHLQGGRIADIGSGAGLPGIPLALACPDREFALVEAAAKKASFLRQAVIDLALGNVAVEERRAEHWHPQKSFDTVTARAVAELRELVRIAGHLCGPGGRLLAMKGAYPDAELEALPEGFTIEKVVRLEVPGLDAERHAVVLRASA